MDSVRMWPRPVGTALLSLVAVAVLLGSPARIDAQVAGVYLGAQVSTASKTDFGVGGRFAIVPASLPVEFVGSVNVFFPEGPTDFWEVNADVVYRFRTPSESSVIPYAGAGINIARLSSGDTDSNGTGINLVGGFRFALGSVTPFLEARGVVSEPDQVMASFGLMF